MKQGILKTNGVHLEDHEYLTVKLLLENGLDIELIPRMQVKGMRTPDISIQGVLWEIKSPTGHGKHTIKHTLQNATPQSRNVIIDLRRCKIQQEQAVNELTQRFNLSKRLRRMKIITDNTNILDFTK